jgi:hypothetical protein
MSRRKALAEREPNGRVQRVSLLGTGEVKRLRDAAMSGMRDPMWGTELGRLHLVGKITAEQFAAGKKWGEFAANYSQALCSPAPDPKAVCWESMGGEPPDPDSPEGRKEARRHVRSVQSFQDAHAALKTTAGASERILRQVCERGEMLCGHAELLSLICGLNGLAHFWGLTDSRKSVVR